MWAACYVFFAFFGVISEKVGFSYRHEYLKAVLRQDTEWFDSIEVLEFPSKMSRECLSIQKATGEKFAMIM